MRGSSCCCAPSLPLSCSLCASNHIVLKKWWPIRRAIDLPWLSVLQWFWMKCMWLQNTVHMGSGDSRSAMPVGSLAAHTQSPGKAGIQNPGQWYKTFKIQNGDFNYNPSFIPQRCVWENSDAREPKSLYGVCVHSFLSEGHLCLINQWLCLQRYVAV